MEEYITNNINTIRVSFFIVIFFILTIVEYLIPRRELLLSKIQRWSNNFALLVLDILIIKLIFPLTLISISLYTQENTIGLLHYFNFSFYVNIIIGIVLLDLIIYWQHRLFHKINFFWIFHRVHHSDMDYDITTGFRFHPIELLFSMIIKITSVFLFGIPLIAVIIFEIILNSLALFNHSNIQLSKRIDTILRKFIVTPDMHRIHHSINNDELNSNFGFNISIWDRLFNSYVNEPKQCYKDIIIGLKNLQDKHKTVLLFSILKMPFIKI